MKRFAAMIPVLVVGCGTANQAPTISNTKAGADSCAVQAAELKSYLTQVFDDTHPKVAVPWPTGDAARDKLIEERRARAREAMKQPMNPAAMAKPLTPIEHKVSAIEQALSPCPAARDKFTSFGEVAPDKRRSSLIEIADGIGACNCNVDVPLVRALLYLFERGPDEPS